MAQLSVELVFICETFAQERNGRELVSVLVNISSQKVKNRLVETQMLHFL